MNNGPEVFLLHHNGEPLYGRIYRSLKAAKGVKTHFLKRTWNHYTEENLQIVRYTPNYDNDPAVKKVDTTHRPVLWNPPEEET